MARWPNKRVWRKNFQYKRCNRCAAIVRDYQAAWRFKISGQGCRKCGGNNFIPEPFNCTAVEWLRAHIARLLRI